MNRSELVEAIRAWARPEPDLGWKGFPDLDAHADNLVWFLEYRGLGRWDPSTDYDKTRKDQR